MALPAGAAARVDALTTAAAGQEWAALMPQANEPEERRAAKRRQLVKALHVRVAQITCCGLACPPPPPPPLALRRCCGGLAALASTPAPLPTLERRSRLTSLAGCVPSCMPPQPLSHPAAAGGSRRRRRRRRAGSRRSAAARPTGAEVPGSKSTAACQRHPACHQRQRRRQRWRRPRSPMQSHAGPAMRRQQQSTTRRCWAACCRPPGGWRSRRSSRAAAQPRRLPPALARG